MSTASRRIVICRCDPKFNEGRGAYSYCDICEARELEAVLAKRGLVAREHPSTDAWDRLVASYSHDEEVA